MGMAAILLNGGIGHAFSEKMFKDYTILYL